MAQKYPFCPFWDQIFVKYGCAVSVCPSAGFCLDSLVREDKQAATEQEARAPLHLLSGHPVKLAGNGKCLWGCNPASICIYPLFAVDRTVVSQTYGASLKDCFLLFFRISCLTLQLTWLRSLSSIPTSPDITTSICKYLAVQLLVSVCLSFFMIPYPAFLHLSDFLHHS